ncbi:MAG: SPOR domain-containing protein [Xanthobacteraceae bacterium]|nr:SPOR domain-containing protein [Xanthobacteraceae bacterium]
MFPRTSPSMEYAAPRGASRSGYDPNSRSVSDSSADPLAELAQLVGDVDAYENTRVDTRPGVRAGQSDAYPLSPAQSGHWDEAAAQTSAPPLAHGDYETAGDEGYASEAYAAEDDYAVNDEAYDQADYDDQQQSRYYGDDQPSGHDPRYAAGQYDYTGQADPYAPYAETQPPGSQRKTLLMAGAVFGLIVVGAIGAYAYRTIAGSAPGVPPVIMADSSPAKVAVTPSDTGNGKQISDRVGDKPQNERVVPREEQPVDLKLSAPQAPVPATGWAAPQQNAVNAAPQAAPAAPSPTDPHPVRTVAIAPNAGTGVPAGSAPIAAAPAQPMPAAAPKAEQRVATQGEAPKPAQPAAHYVVQISASNTREEATAALRAAQARYADVLGGRHSQVKPKKSGENATVYAAQFGPFASRAEAAELCQRLKSAGGTCFVQ